MLEPLNYRSTRKSAEAEYKVVNFPRKRALVPQPSGAFCGVAETRGYFSAGLFNERNPGFAAPFTRG